MEAGKGLVAVRVDVRRGRRGLDRHFADLVEPGVGHHPAEVVDPWISGKLDLDRLGKADGERLSMPDDLFGIGDGAHVATGDEHTKGFEVMRGAVPDMMDDIDREDEVERRV